MMNEDQKKLLAQRMGVPASLLTGDTEEENIARAKALLAYKKQAQGSDPHQDQRQRSKRSTADLFADWFNSQVDEDGLAAAPASDPAAAGGYPQLHDGGEARDLPDSRPAREQFADWLNGWQQ